MEVKQLAFYKRGWEVKHVTTEKQIQLVLKAYSKLGLHDASSIFSLIDLALLLYLKCKVYNNF